MLKYRIEKHQTLKDLFKNAEVEDLIDVGGHAEAQQADPLLQVPERSLQRERERNKERYREIEREK